MKINRFSVQKYAILGIAVCALILMAINSIFDSVNKKKHPIKFTKTETPEEIVIGEKFEVKFHFYKMRDDCRDPYISRYLINVETGNPTKLTDVTFEERVVQYPVKISGEPHVLSLTLKSEEGADPGQSFMATDVCYICDGRPICLPNSSNIIRVVNKGQRNDQSELDRSGP